MTVSQLPAIAPSSRRRLTGGLAILFLLAAISLLPRSAAIFQSLGFQLPEFGLLALAMAVVMFAGGINLSIIATANLSAISAAWWLSHSSGSALAGVGAVGLALLVGTSCGALIGASIAWLNISPILASLCGMLVFSGLSVLVTNGAAIGNLPDYVAQLANLTLLGVPLITLLFFLLALLLGLLLHFSVFGAFLRAIGLNATAAAFSGVNVAWVQIRVYALSGGLSAIAGLVMMGRFNSASAAYGDAYLLTAILAAVLGGISPDGGKGRISGLVLAIIVLQVVASALNLLNIDAHLTSLLWGLMLLAKLGVDRCWRRHLRVKAP